jgi:hypothetical protein
MPRVAMTAAVQRWPPMFPWACTQVLASLDEPAPGRHAGCSCGSPWGAYPLPGVRQVPVAVWGRGGQRDGLGNRPHKRPAFPRDSTNHVIGGATGAPLPLT